MFQDFRQVLPAESGRTNQESEGSGWTEEWSERLKRCRLMIISEVNRGTQPTEGSSKEIPMSDADNVMTQGNGAKSS